MAIELLVVLGIYLIMTVSGTYLAFYRFTSNTWLKQFCFGKDGEIPDLSDPFKRSEAVKNFVYSNGLRSILLGIMFIIIMILFTDDYLNIHFILNNPLYQIGVSVMLIENVLWCFIFGPLNMARRFKAKPKCKEHFRPYICDLPNIAAPVVVLAPLIFGAVVLRAVADIQYVSSAEATISQAIRQLSIIELVGWKSEVIKSIYFGYDIVSLMQKYIVLGVVIMLYSIAEQKTFMRKTILPASVDYIKISAWIILFVGVVIGMLILPAVYFRIYSLFQTRILSVVNANNLKEEVISCMTEILSALESHNVEWLMRESLLGFGNLIVYSIVGTSYIFRKIIFKSSQEVMEFILPSFVYKALKEALMRTGVFSESKTD